MVSGKKRGLEIGDLEAEVLRVLKSVNDASAGEMAERMQSERTIAYTTVSTTLDRLFKKGLVSRKSVAGKTGQKYVYSFVNDPGIERQLVDSAVGRLVDAFGPSVKSTIYDKLSEVSPVELESLNRKVQQRRRTLEST
jgi:predicted transcriptional regulator